MLPARVEGESRRHGWFSEQQAGLVRTLFYMDQDGHEVEVSSVSYKESGRPPFSDTRFVGMVQEGRYRTSGNATAPQPVAVGSGRPHTR